MEALCTLINVKFLVVRSSMMRLVVETRQVINEYIQIRIQRITTQQEVRGTVRREVFSATAHPAEGCTTMDVPFLHEIDT